MTYSTSQVNGWKIVNLIRLIEMDKHLTELRITIWIIVAAILVSVTIISYFISIKITNPLRKFIGKLEIIGDGNFDERLPEEKNCYEINVLNKVFNRMMDRICRLISEVYTVKIKQKEAEFEALQAKINPHFLCNTLQSITSLAVLGQNSDIERVSVSLGNLLEYTVYEREEMVQVCKEMDYIRNYIAIQNIRYGNSINISYEIDKEIEELYILKLMLQPLVENALYHGLEKKSDDKRITVKAKMENGIVLFEIEDNGIGMNEERLQEVKRRLCGKETQGKSIGLANVHERIQLKFGAEYGVEIYSEYGCGTRVEIRIPAIKTPGRNEYNEDNTGG